MRFLVLALFLTGCGEYRVPVNKHNPLSIPPELAYCGHDGAYVRPLSNVRDAKQLANYANKLEYSRDKLLVSIENCDGKRAQLYDMVNQGR